MTSLPPDIEAFLTEASTRCGQPIDELLRQVFHEHPRRMSDLFFANAPETTRTLVDHLDRELRLRNPGLQYVRRSTYVGFRREELPVRVKDGRSQIFASVRIGLRPDRILVALPATADDVDELTRRRLRLKDFRRANARHQGHHGVGDIGLDLRAIDEVQLAIAAFDNWLRTTTST